MTLMILFGLFQSLLQMSQDSWSHQVLKTSKLLATLFPVYFVPIQGRGTPFQPRCSLFFEFPSACQSLHLPTVCSQGINLFLWASLRTEDHRFPHHVGTVLTFTISFGLDQLFREIGKLA
jgi:hypothetical protein